MTPISLNGNSLQTANIITSEIDDESIPEKDAQIFNLSHGNRAVNPITTYPKKRILLSGSVIASSKAALEAQLELMRSWTTGSGNLDIGYNATTRRYAGIVSGFSAQRQAGLTRVDFSLEFTALQFGMDLTDTNLLNISGRTASGFSDNLTFGGTAPEQYPYIVYTLSAVTGGTSQSLVFSNTNSSQSLSLARSWAAGDQVVIDTFNKLVLVNGSVFAPVGAFPIFVPGAGILSIADTFTTRTFNYVISYRPRYL